MSIEKLVRAFQAPVTRRVTEVRAPEVQEDAVLSWDANTSADKVTIGPATTPGFKVNGLNDNGGKDEKDPENTFKEKDRDEREKRVENPDDPDQYIMVKTVSSITAQGPALTDFMRKLLRSKGLLSSGRQKSPGLTHESFHGGSGKKEYKFQYRDPEEGTGDNSGMSGDQPMGGGYGGVSYKAESNVNPHANNVITDELPEEMLPDNAGSDEIQEIGA